MEQSLSILQNPVPAFLKSSVAFPVTIATKALMLQRRTLKLREEEQLTPVTQLAGERPVRTGSLPLLLCVWCCEPCPLTLALPEVVCRASPSSLSVGLYAVCLSPPSSSFLSVNLYGCMSRAMCSPGTAGHQRIIKMLSSPGIQRPAGMTLDRDEWQAQ